MSNRRHREEDCTLDELVIRGRVILTLGWGKQGPWWRPQAGIKKLTPAEKEMTANWLSKALVGVTHDDAYTLLFGS